MEVAKLMEHLGKVYDSSKVLPPTEMYSSENRKYLLNPIKEDSFRNYNPWEVKRPFNVLAVDGGSLAIFDTPYWGLGFIKLRARYIHFDPKKKEGKTIETRSKDGFVLFLNDSTASGESIVKRKFYEKGNYLKREEMRFVRDVLKEGFIKKDDLLLIDGALSMQSFYEKELVKLHKNIIGISKRSGMMINKYSAASFLGLKAKEYEKMGKPWYCYPLVKKYPGESIAEILFANFTPNGEYAFRVDFPNEYLGAMNVDDQYRHIAEQLSKVALFSFDPKYRGYPYPLGAVHTDAVMRPIDGDRAREFVEKQIEEMDMAKEAKELIKKDIENEYWYEKFRRRA